ncbi:MAG TPA: nuclear transport factor 2 family protein [Herpetosiphonaceae bacterium]|nr:nuclear transport factor 2 family protein [Herpetosiphonaceae bacterium]
MQTDVIDSYFAMWNETDAERRRALIAQAWAEDASYVDPVMSGAGHAGLDAMVAAVQDRFAGHRFQRTGPIETVQDRLRFTWELAAAGAPPVVKGTDFGQLAGDGRLQSITGFFDTPPHSAG